MSEIISKESSDQVSTVLLNSREGESFELEIDIAKQSDLIKSMIDESAEEIQEIPLPNVESSILSKVIVYCRHYAIEPMKEFEKVL